MIVLTRLSDAKFAINTDLIERIHESPDTTLVTVDGSSYVVKESMAQVIDLIAAYRARILAAARDAKTEEGPSGGLAEVVPLKRS